MSIELWAAFVATSAVLLAMPGPTVLTIMTYSISHGRRAKTPLLTAVALGDSTSLALSVVGVGALLAASTFWFTVVKYAGGLYLLYLGFKHLRPRAAPDHPTAAPLLDTRWRLTLNTYLVTVLNPQAIIFFVAFLPQFIDPARDATRQLWMMALTFITLDICNTSLYALFANAARRHLTTPRAQRIIQLTGGSLLSLAGIAALLAQRAG